MGVVIDTNVIIAFANAEDDKDLGSIEKIYELVLSKRMRALISAITISEIFAYYFKRNDRRKAVELDIFIRETGINVLEVTDKIARISGILKSKYPVSYADCIIMATARELDYPLITYDPELLEISGLEIKILKPEEFIKKK